MSLFKPIPYREYRCCSLTEGKDWVISYYVMNPETQRLKRIRMRMNRIENIRERRKTARKIMASIDERLALGWNPLIEFKTPKAYEKLFDTFNIYLKVKSKDMEPTSVSIYTSFIKSFREWLEKKGFNEDSYTSSVTFDVVVDFMEHIEKDKSIRTYNNYLGFFKGMFSWMCEKGYVAGNPFDNISKKSKKQLKKNRRMLTDEELHSLMQYVRNENREYLAMCLICYCCFVRPKEIALLKCKDIDLEKQLIHIDSEIAKNDNESYRTIPDDLMPVMRELDLSHPTYYLFGQHEGTGDFRPSPKQVCSRKIAKWWDQHVRPACGFGQEIKFYSLKDTGITNMLNTGVPINLVQQQADHSSVAMTAIYVGKKKSANEALKKSGIIGI